VGLAERLHSVAERESHYGRVGVGRISIA